MSVTLDNIPAELRLKIYRNLFILPPMKVCKCNPQYNLIPPDKRCHINMQYKATSQLLRVCQLFFNEGVPILYEENEFLAGSRHCTNLFMAMLEKRDGYIDEIKSFTFGGLDDFKKRYGFAVIERAPRLKNLRLGGNFLYDSVEVTQWDKSALIRQGEVVQAGSIIHDRLPAFPQAKMDRFARKGTNIVAITKVSMVVSRRGTVLHRVYKFQLVPTTKQCVRAEGLSRPCDLIFLGSESLEQQQKATDDEKLEVELRRRAYTTRIYQQRLAYQQQRLASQQQQLARQKSKSWRKSDKSKSKQNGDRNRVGDTDILKVE